MSTITICAILWQLLYVDKRLDFSEQELSVSVDSQLLAPCSDSECYGAL